MNFMENLNTQGVPIDLNVDIPNKTFLWLGLALFGAMLLSLIFGGIITHAITKRM